MDTRQTENVTYRGTSYHSAQKWVKIVLRTKFFWKRKRKLDNVKGSNKIWDQKEFGF